MWIYWFYLFVILHSVIEEWTSFSMKLNCAGMCSSYDLFFSHRNTFLLNQKVCSKGHLLYFLQLSTVFSNFYQIISCQTFLPYRVFSALKFPSICMLFLLKAWSHLERHNFLSSQPKIWEQNIMRSLLTFHEKKYIFPARNPLFLQHLKL